MAQPCTQTPLWRKFLAFMYTLVVYVAPWLMLFYRFNRSREDARPVAVQEPIATAPVPVSDVESEIDTESNQDPSESTDQSTSVLSLSQPEESSEPEDPAFVTSKTGIDPNDHDQVSADPPTAHVPGIQAGDKTTAKGRHNDLMHVRRRIDALSQEISSLRNYVQEIEKENDTNGIGETDETSDEETSPYVSTDLPPEDDGDDDVDAKKGHTQQVTSSASPQETAATGGNVSEGPPEDQDTTQVAASAETGQTLDGSSCNDLPIGPLRSLIAEERNTASDYFTGTPDNGRPPENNDWERQGDGDIDSGPREMLYLDNNGPFQMTSMIGIEKQSDFFSAEDLSSGPCGLFEIEGPPEPPNDPGTLELPTGDLHKENVGHTTWGDCGGGINDVVDSGPKGMLLGVSLSKALMDIRLNYGEDEDDDLDKRYHGDVCFGDDQPSQDAWDLERNEEAADRGLVVSAMQHVSKPPGQDMGIVGEDMDDLKLSIEATGNEKDNSRTSFDMPMEPQGRPHVNNNNNNNNNYNYNNDAIGRTPDINCG